jgi:hypothetical protein
MFVYKEHTEKTEAFGTSSVARNSLVGGPAENCVGPKNICGKKFYTLCHGTKKNKVQFYSKSHAFLHILP